VKINQLIKQYIPSKPEKYGIKFWMISDSTTSYVCRFQAYTGKEPDEARERNQSERVVLDLVENLKCSGRNITCDNFFTSLSLIQKLKKDKLTLLGTVRQNRTDFHPDFVDPKGREAMSSKFDFHEDAAFILPQKGKDC